MKIYSFTDETGQDTKGEFFIVSSVIIDNKNKDFIENLLLSIEKESRKKQKWSHSNKQEQENYLNLLLQKGILKNISCYYSIYINTLEYNYYTAKHISYSLSLYNSDMLYAPIICIDKIDKKSLISIQRNLRMFHTKYKKVVGLKDESSAFIRLADAICGMLRNSKRLKISNRLMKYLTKI